MIEYGKYGHCIVYDRPTPSKSDRSSFMSVFTGIAIAMGSAVLCNMLTTTNLLLAVKVACLNIRGYGKEVNGTTRQTQQPKSIS